MLRNQIQNKPLIIRIHQPTPHTLSKETISSLKNTGNNAFKVIELIQDAFPE